MDVRSATSIVLAIAAASLCAVSPGSAATPDRDGTTILALRAQMLRIADIDWRLRVAAVTMCPDHSAGFGLWFDQATAYPTSDAAALFRALRLDRSLQVAAVATSSPAALAGIRPGDQIEVIGTTRIADAFARSADPSLFAQEMTDLLAASSETGPLTLVIRRGKMTLRKAITPEPVCAGRTVLETDSSLQAHTDDRDVSISTALVDFSDNDDELALFLGHELAHVILAGSSATSRTSAQLELNADLMGSAIARCAGFDMRRAVGVWHRFDLLDPYRLARLATHPSPREREQNLERAAEIPACPTAPQTGGR